VLIGGFLDYPHIIGRLGSGVKSFKDKDN
jgi:hypothetical protein